MSYELITMGRVGVDLYPAQIGVTLDRVEQFNRYLGGTATNVAVAAARYGHRSAVITKVGDDPFGTYVRRALEGFGVDPAFVGTHPELRTPIVFCEVHPPDHFPILFYRQPTAPDVTLSPEELPLDAISQTRIFWTTGTGLSVEPSRTATLAALDAARGTVIHDLDYRPSLWADPGEASEWQREALKRATVAVGNVEECSVAVGGGSPEEMAQRIFELGVEVVIVKQGGEGVTAFVGDRRCTPTRRGGRGERARCGRRFGGALCHGLLEAGTGPRRSPSPTPPGPTSPPSSPAPTPCRRRRRSGS